MTTPARSAGTWSSLAPRPLSTLRWLFGRRSGGKRTRRGRCAASRTSCTWTTAPTSSATTLNGPRSPCTSGSSTRPSADPRDEGRSSGSSAPLTPNFWPLFPTTSDPAAGHRRRSWILPVSIVRSAHSLAPTTTESIASWGSHRATRGLRMAGCLGCPTASQNSTGCSLLFRQTTSSSPPLPPFVVHMITIRYAPRDISEIRVYARDTFICPAIDEAHPNLRLSLRDIETARRARRKQLRRAINDRIPTVASREEPRTHEAAAEAAHLRRGRVMNQAFIVTKEHRRFTEFANAVRKEKTIGICHGAAGVGKTNSAPPFANSHPLHPYIHH